MVVYTFIKGISTTGVKDKIQKAKAKKIIGGMKIFMKNLKHSYNKFKYYFDLYGLT